MLGKSWGLSFHSQESPRTLSAPDVHFVLAPMSTYSVPLLRVPRRNTGVQPQTCTDPSLQLLVPSSSPPSPIPGLLLLGGGCVCPLNARPRGPWVLCQGPASPTLHPEAGCACPPASMSGANQAAHITGNPLLGPKQLPSLGHSVFPLQAFRDLRVLDTATGEQAELRGGTKPVCLHSSRRCLCTRDRPWELRCYIQTGGKVLTGKPMLSPGSILKQTDGDRIFGQQVQGRQ